MLLQVVEQLATAGGHLEKAAAGVEILAMRAKVLGQVIDPGAQQCDLDFGRAGILLVGFILCDDRGFNYGGGHGLVVDLHDCRELLRAPCHPPETAEAGPGRRHRSNPAEAGPVMVATRNRRVSTDARSKLPKPGGWVQAKFLTTDHSDFTDIKATDQGWPQKAQKAQNYPFRILRLLSLMWPSSGFAFTIRVIRG